VLLIEDCCIHIITIKLVRWLSVDSSHYNVIFSPARQAAGRAAFAVPTKRMGARGFARLLLILGSRRFGKFNPRERLLGGVHPKLQNRAPYRRHRPNVETSTMYGRSNVYWESANGYLDQHEPKHANAALSISIISSCYPLDRSGPRAIS
jgi:hypothetical protein